MTLSRIPLAAVLWWVWGDPAWSAALVVLAGITDAADGRVARWIKRRGGTGPDIGGWLDPAVDKLFVAVVLAAIWVHTGRADVIALVGARELVLVPLTIRGTAIDPSSTGRCWTIACPCATTSGS